MEQKKFKSRVYGIILETEELRNGEKEYVVVQGRETGRWSFPKGHSQRGETPLECAWRELEEETSIQRSALPLQPMRSLRLGNTQLFLFQIKKRIPVRIGDAKEVMNCRWVTRTELKALPSNLGIQEFLGRRKEKLKSMDRVKEDCSATPRLSKPPRMSDLLCNARTPMNAPPPVALTWSLSHQEEAWESAREFMDQLQEGETIFLNYWINQHKKIHYAWLEMVNGVLKEKEQTCALEDLPRNWTYEGVPPPYKMVHSFSIPQDAIAH